MRLGAIAHTRVNEDDMGARADIFFDMANVGQKGGAKHDVRVNVSPNLKAVPSDLISVAIRPEVRVVDGNMSGSDLALLRQWIKLNEDVIIRYWNSEIDTGDALQAIRSL